MYVRIALIAIIFVTAPMTWTYVASVNGFLIRSVDIALLLLCLFFTRSYQFFKFPLFVPACILLLVGSLLLRGMIYSEMASAVSSVKLIYYCLTFLVLGSWIYVILKHKDYSQVLIKVLVVLVMLIIGSYYQVILDVAGSLYGMSLGNAIFKFWNGIFSSNIFPTDEVLDVRGVAFRNSAGIAFFVSSLFFYHLGTYSSRLLALFFFVVAALFFSRSVWLVQVLLIFMLVLRVRTGGVATLMFVFLGLGYVLFSNPDILDAVQERVFSELGRSEMVTTAMEVFDRSILFGRSEGASIWLAGEGLRPVHNVPLAFGLKTGMFGFVLASCVVLYFLFYFCFFFFRFLFSRSGSQKDVYMILSVLSFVLFFRPLISASHEVFFSIGEWLALSLYLAIFKKSTLEK